MHSIVNYVLVSDDIKIINFLFNQELAGFFFPRKYYQIKKKLFAWNTSSWRNMAARRKRLGNVSLFSHYHWTRFSFLEMYLQVFGGFPRTERCIYLLWNRKIFLQMFAKCKISITHRLPAYCNHNFVTIAYDKHSIKWTVF